MRDPLTATRFSLVPLGFFMSFLLQGCFGLQTPGVKDASRSLAVFTHSGMETSCIQCHEKDRPAAVLVNGMLQVHGDGKDCLLCHKAGGTWTASGAFSHNPVPASCSNCHDSKRPVGLVGPVGSQFDHLKGGMGDCVSCHASMAGISWTGGRYAHTSATTTCISCHIDRRPVGLVGPSGNQFDHANGGTGDCVSCHNQSPGISWANAFYNHLPAPTSCIGCHISDRPTGLVGPAGSQFDHANGGTGDCISCHKGTPGTTWANGAFSHTPVPNSCIECHLSKRPVGAINKFDHSVAGSGDCKSCHKNPGVAWSGAVYGHTPIPTDCYKCHLSSRPVGLVGPAGNQFDHANGGTGECSICHTEAPGTTWAGGAYAHSPTPTTCIACHLGRRPVGLVGPAGNQFDHANNGTGDCISCHKSTPGTVWTGGFFNHVPAPTTCIDCHLSDRPIGLVGPAGSQFNHANGGTGDCISCHKSTPGTVWTGGQFSHTPLPISCAGCHADKRPTALVGPIGQQFDHDNFGMGDCYGCHKQNAGVAWTNGTFSHSPAPTTCITCHIGRRPSTLVNGFDHSKNGTGDCVACHKSPGVSWTGGQYNHSPVPNACATCHQGSMPSATTLVPNNLRGFMHSTTYLGGNDCKACHTAVPANIGVTWAGGKYSHSPKPTSCKTCHSGLRPTISYNVGTWGNFKHSNQGKHGNYDCVTCHTYTVGTSWVIPSPQANNCTLCHKSKP